jgi:hypothetical protein
MVRAWNCLFIELVKSVIAIEARDAIKQKRLTGHSGDPRVNHA